MNQLDPTPNYWSKEAEDERSANDRPTEEDPHFFDIEDAVKSVAFSQVPGEKLRGTVAGYFYRDGHKINLVGLTKDSAERAGWPAGEYMKVPQEVIEKGVVPGPGRAESHQGNHEELVLEASEALALEAFEMTGPEEPANDAEAQLIDAAHRVNGTEPAIVEGAPERAKDPVLEKLFAPPVRPEIPQGPGNRYDILFSKDEEEVARYRAEQAELDRKNQPMIEAQKTYDRLTNKDTREYSEQQLAAVLRRDPELRALLGEKGFSEASLEAVDALREDAELRYRAGEHLLRKLNVMIEQNRTAGGNSFGDRIIADRQKRTDYLVLPVSTTSRQYTAYLALAKISGMFNYKDDSSDVFKDQDEKGNIIINQHRHAADMIL